MENTRLVSTAASALGSIRTARKAASSRKNLEKANLARSRITSKKREENMAKKIKYAVIDKTTGKLASMVEAPTLASAKAFSAEQLLDVRRANDEDLIEFGKSGAELKKVTIATRKKAEDPDQIKMSETEGFDAGTVAEPESASESDERE